MTLDKLVLPEHLDLLHWVLGGTALLSLMTAMIFIVYSLRLKSRLCSKANDKAPVASIETQMGAEVGSLQLLNLLQAEARFVDFVQEDLSAHGDAEIGAAARVVHQGCRKLLERYFDIAPIHAGQEGSRVTLEKGFDPALYRLTGQVLGEPPFQGHVIHRGWKVNDVHLPSLTQGHDFKVIMPSEVEL